MTDSLGHLRRYSKNLLEGLLSKHGFEIELCRYWNSLALLPYIFVEKIMRRPLSDNLRYHGADAESRVFGPLLRLWYTQIENRFSFPLGLSLFVVANRY